MKITIQLTSWADAERGETERMTEYMTIEMKRNGQTRDAFLRDVAKSIRFLATQHNAIFEATHAPNVQLSASISQSSTVNHASQTNSQMLVPS